MNGERLAGAALLFPALALIVTIACGGGPQSTPSPTSQASPSGSTPLPTISITFNPGTPGEATLTVEIADEPEERRRGLMARETLPPDAGMLFDSGEETTGAFWMKDTVIPLSIAFIAADGRVIDIQDMEPLDETFHRSPEPYRWAVEANQGWFASHAVAAGDEARVPTPP